jgi:2-keto-4-pentenoate hydratase/2-oxohepta-3-ene-1,7-dioic acid hydratase in catechol pathway
MEKLPVNPHILKRRTENIKNMKIARVISKSGQIVNGALIDNDRLHRVEGDIFKGDLQVTDETIEVDKWLEPVEPKVIICVAANYRAHIKESDLKMKTPDYPIFFMKNISAANAHLEPIRLPQVCDDEVDFEGELAIVISKKCLNVSKQDAMDYVLGYTVSNDVSARIWQLEKGGGQWCRGKGFDGFCPLGPYLVTKDELGSASNLSIKTLLNGQVVQDGNTNLMIFDIPTLISFISQDTTLLPGTVILTGTPAGVGWARNPKLLLKKGDTISVEIEKIGMLINPVE